MSIWTQASGTVKIPKHANFSIKKSFEDQPWEGYITNTRKVNLWDHYIDYVEINVSYDCLDMCLAISSWFNTFPKGSEIDLDIKGRYLAVQH